MTVYVDDMYASFARMKMCHMIADTEEELHAMADAIGVKRKWFQGDHYDIAKSKRDLAVAKGAVEITWRQAGCMCSMRNRDPNVKLITPDIAEEALRVRAQHRLTQAQQQVVDANIVATNNNLNRRIFA